MQVDYRAQFESDYEAYADAIFRFLYYRLQNRERALEITQDVFTRYFQYLADGNQVEHVKTFLYRSASNAFINEIRTKKRVVSLEEAVDSGLEVAYDGHDAEQMSQQREAVERIRSLEDPYRSVLVMRYVDDLSVGEIAQVLNAKENTVSVWIKRGVEQLRTIYE